MKRTRMILMPVLAGVLGAMAGCASAGNEVSEPQIPHAVIMQTTLPVKVDGALDDAAWALTPGFALERIDNYSGLPTLEAARYAKDPFEQAVVKFLYDDKYLYVACALEDSDVIAYKKQDQEMLFRDGDLLEIFIKPVKANCYWEMYAAPNGAKSSFYYPGGICGVEEFFTADKLMPGFEVAARVGGTLNKHDDRDTGWSAEMKIPLSELSKYGVKFGPGSEWTIMASRYNYSSGLYGLQPSSFPRMPTFGYHSREYYAPVDFR